MDKQLVQQIVSNVEIRRFVTLDAKLGRFLIPLAFWVFTVVSILSGLKLIFTGGFWLGLIVILVLPVVGRIVGESFLQLFDMVELLKRNQSK